MIFCPKMPEFYTIIARNIFSQILRARASPAPVSYAYGKLVTGCIFTPWGHNKQNLGNKTHSIKPNTHRRRRRDETVESRRVGGEHGVNTPVGSRDPVYNFLC